MPVPLPQSLYGQTIAGSYSDVITKFTQLDWLPKFRKNGAPLARLRFTGAPLLNRKPYVFVVAFEDTCFFLAREINFKINSAYKVDVTLYSLRALRFTMRFV